MGALETLVELVKGTVIPRLNELGDDVKKMASDMQDIMLGQARQQGKIEVLEEQFRALKCDENTDIMRGHGSRIANIEAHIENSHKQDEECKAKNEKVDEALRLAKQNKKKNEDQEERHKTMLAEQKEKNDKIVNRLWLLIVTVIGVALAPWFSKLWGIATKGGL